MIVAIATNHPEFLNDLAEEVRLFIDASDISLYSPDMSYDICIEAILHEREAAWCASAKITDNHGSALSNYDYESPSASGSDLIIKRYQKRFFKVAVFRALKLLYPDVQTPWGSLTGIRPTRLLRELEDANGERRAKDIMLNDFDVSPEKYALAHGINLVQSEFIKDALNLDADIYVGIPYCKTRCLYCSFLSGLRTKSTDMASYITALKRDISHGANILHEGNYRIKRLYVGGGTPTVLTAEELYDLLSHCISEYKLDGRINEITVEAGRPDTIDTGKLQILRSLGISRISINPQTMNQHTLDIIGRSHTVDEIEKCFYTAHDMGFIINMDIITCLPGENIDDVKHTLERILKLAPQNITVHTLALKRSSLLKQTIENYPLPDDITARDMVLVSDRTIRESGYIPYYMYRQKYMRGNLENVGFTLPGYECAYNIDMMEETVSIMAHGAGAMTKRVYPGHDVRVERLPNPKDVKTYTEKLDILFSDKERLFRP